MAWWWGWMVLAIRQRKLRVEIIGIHTIVDMHDPVVSHAGQLAKISCFGGNWQRIKDTNHF